MARDSGPFLTDSLFTVHCFFLYILSVFSIQLSRGSGRGDYTIQTHPNFNFLILFCATGRDFHPGSAASRCMKTAAACPPSVWRACLPEGRPAQKRVTIHSVMSFVQLVERTLRRIRHVSEYVSIDHCCLDIFVTEQILHFPDIYS